MIEVFTCEGACVDIDNMIKGLLKLEKKRLPCGNLFLLLGKLCNYFKQICVF